MPLFPAAASDAHDLARMAAFTEALVGALRAGRGPLEAIWLTVPADEPSSRRRLAASLLKAAGRPTTEALEELSSAAPADESDPPDPPAAREPLAHGRTAPDTGPPAASTAPTRRPPPEPTPARGGPDRDPTHADRPADPRFLALAHDEAITTSYPLPIAAAWHTAIRRLEPEARAQSLYAAAEVSLRTVTAILLADYLRGRRVAAADQAITELHEPTQGHWSKAVAALTAAILTRATPAPFFPELAPWARSVADDESARGLARRLVELRNASSHGRRGFGPGAAERAADEAEAALRRYLATLRWLGAYFPFVVVEQRWTREQRFSGHWHIYRGRDALPRPTRVAWRAHLAGGGCYLLSPRRDEALDLAPFLGTQRHPDSGEDVLMLAEALPGRRSVSLREPGGLARATIVFGVEGPAGPLPSLEPGQLHRGVSLLDLEGLDG